MTRKVLYLTAGLLATLLCAAGAFGATTIYPVNYSFGADAVEVTEAGGDLEGSTFPNPQEFGWTITNPNSNQYIDIINNADFWWPGVGMEGVIGAQYCLLWGAMVSPNITQTLQTTVAPGAQYQLSVDLAGNYPGFPSVGATLALDAGGVAIASTAITTDQLASGVFDTYSTGLMLPNQSLVGTPLTVTITPGSTGSYSQDSLAGVGVDNVRILQYNFIPGDANGDGKVDINDLTIVLGHYNQQGMTWTEGDFTGDGVVDINDLTIVLANYNTTATYGGPAAVPEPGGAVMLIAGLMALLVGLRPIACGAFHAPYKDPQPLAPARKF